MIVVLNNKEAPMHDTGFHVLVRHCGVRALCTVSNAPIVSRADNNAEQHQSWSLKHGWLEPTRMRCAREKTLTKQEIRARVPLRLSMVQ